MLGGGRPRPDLGGRGPRGGRRRRVPVSEAALAYAFEAADARSAELVVVYAWPYRFDERLADTDVAPLA